jgi:hypothetical protein
LSEKRSKGVLDSALALKRNIAISAEIRDVVQ